MMRNRKGSLTVEAALVLPVFLCAVISIVFLVKAVLVHEIIQHAISETANELSTYSYIVTVSRLDEVDKHIQDGVRDKAGRFEEHISSYMEGYNALTSFKEDIKEDAKEALDRLRDGGTDLEAIDDLQYDLENTKQKIENAVKGGKEAFANPAEEVAGMLFSMGGFAYDRSKGALLGEISKIFIKKYLKTDKLPDAGKRLEALNIEGGFEGLDFSKSKFLDSSENIEIVVQYKLNLALPYNIMPDIHICQKAYARAWMDGDGFEDSSADGKGVKEDEGSIWDLPPMTRGQEIQKRFYSKNTPRYFKVLTRFENGLATKVSSIDTRAKTYQKMDNLKDTVIRDIKELYEFEGDSRDGFTVRKEDIREKKLIIVVPKGELSEEQKKVLDQCIAEAKAYGINMDVDEL